MTTARRPDAGQRGAADRPDDLVPTAPACPGACRCPSDTALLCSGPTPGWLGDRAGRAGLGAQGVVGIEREPDAAAAITIGGWDEGIAAQVTDNVRMLLAEHLDVVYADLDLEATTDPDSRCRHSATQGFSYAGLRLHGPGNHDHLLPPAPQQHRGRARPDQHPASPAGHELVRFVLEDLEAHLGRYERTFV